MLVLFAVLAISTSGGPSHSGSLQLFGGVKVLGEEQEYSDATRQIPVAGFVLEAGGRAIRPIFGAEQGTKKDRGFRVTVSEATLGVRAVATDGSASGFVEAGGVGAISRLKGSPGIEAVDGSGLGWFAGVGGSVLAGTVEIGVLVRVSRCRVDNPKELEVGGTHGLVFLGFPFR